MRRLALTRQTQAWAFPAVRVSILLLLALWAPASLRADEVVFGEQERLSGTLLHLTDGQLTLRSAVAGEVTVPWSAVTDLRTAGPVAVYTADGNRILGVLAGVEAGRLRVVGAESTVLVDTALVTRIGPAVEPEKTTPAPPRVQWIGQVEVGLGVLAGNSRRQDYRLGTEIRRRTPVDRWHLTASAHQGQSQGRTDVSRARFGLTYSRNLWGRHYASAGAFLNHDDMKRLRLGGYYFLSKGYRIVDAAPNRWDLEIGGTYVNDNYRFEQRESFTGLVRSITEHRVFGDATFRAVWMVWPNLARLRHVRGTGTFSLDVPVARKTSLRFGLAEDYDSRPPAGTRPHDLQTSLTLVYRL